MVRTRSSHSLILLFAGILFASAAATAEDKARDAFLRKPAFQNNLDSKTQKQTGAGSPRALTDAEVEQRQQDRENGEVHPDIVDGARSPSEATAEGTPAAAPAESAPPPSPVVATSEPAGEPAPDKNRKYGIIALLVVIAIVVRSFRRRR